MTRPLHPSDPVQFLAGVGPKKAESLARRGIQTHLDLLYLMPREYLDLREIQPIAQLVEDEVRLVRGQVIWLDYRRTKTGMPLVEMQCSDGSATLTVCWFHRPDLRETLAIDQRIELTGKAKWVDGHWRMTNPKVRLASPTESSEGIVPVYPASQEFRSEEIRALVRQVLPLAEQVESLLPESFARTKGLLPLGQAIRSIHEPTTIEEAVRAKRRLMYEEFLQFALASALKRSKRARQRGYAIDVSDEVDRRIRRLFPFELTPSQNEAVQGTVGDLRTGHPMHRLLQGDVGSGKTAVAIYAILAVVAAGYQAVFLAPTEVLARQQFRVLDEYLSRSRVRRRLFTGGLSAGDRQAILEPLHRGEIDLIVGTHALLQPDVAFARLALVVIDEQHKFGVRQRAELLDQQTTPHQIVMTATPIPRSLAMTWFGDLDLTTIRLPPEGRGKVLTHVVPEAMRPQAHDFIVRQARQGERVLVVCPRIESGDGLHGAEDVYRELVARAGGDLPIGLVHGKMEDNAKDDAVRRFRRGDLLILVATIVIEVGLDVPDASIVLIEDAERFGLSQLHQIRGRVGRSHRAGTCLLLERSSEEESPSRLHELAACHDGFAIAELDATVRGIGDPLGERQHGAVRPKIGDFLTQTDLLAECRQDAEQIVQADPGLRDPVWAKMRQALLDRFAQSFGLALVG